MVLKRHWRKIVNLLLIISLGILAGTQLGSGGGPPLATSYFSAGRWDGSPASSSEYTGGVLAASTGSLSDPSVAASMCNYSSNTAFDGGVDALLNGNKHPSSFWFLTSYYFAQNTCGLDLTPYGGAYGWGVLNAGRFLDVIGDSAHTGDVLTHLADVEYCWWSSAYTYCDCFVDCTDLAGWAYDSATNNRAVIKGFTDELNNRAVAEDVSASGVYSSVSQWSDITNDATYSDVNSPYDKVFNWWFWLAYWGNSQSVLTWYATTLDNWGYDIFSWQYGTYPACQAGSLSNARSLAAGASPRVNTIDLWVNDDASHWCQ